MDDRQINLVAALVVALADELAAATSGIGNRAGVDEAALATVLGNPGSRVEALAPVLGLSGSGVVRVVDRLAAAGLVERRRSESDQRAVTVWLTDRGSREARAAVTARREAVSHALRSASPQQRRTLAELAEPVLADLAGNRERADRICRLCDYSACPQADCPVEGSVP